MKVIELTVLALNYCKCLPYTFEKPHGHFFFNYYESYGNIFEVLILELILKEISFIHQNISFKIELKQVRGPE